MRNSRSKIYDDIAINAVLSNNNDFKISSIRQITELAIKNKYEDIQQAVLCIRFIHKDCIKKDSEMVQSVYNINLPNNVKSICLENILLLTD